MPIPPKMGGRSRVWSLMGRNCICSSWFYCIFDGISCHVLLYKMLLGRIGRLVSWPICVQSGKPLPHGSSVFSAKGSPIWAYVSCFLDLYLHRIHGEHNEQLVVGPSQWPFRCGLHTEAAHSMTGLTRVLYASSMVGWEVVLMFRLVNPSAQFPFAATLFTCLCQVRSLVAWIPRYVAVSTSSRSVPLIWYFCSIGSFFLEIWMMLHFEGLKHIPQVFSQRSRETRSSCSWVQSLSVRTSL